MLNSIEHLTSFHKDFMQLDKAMKDRSTIIIETPNFTSLDSYIFKKYWGGLHQPRHTFLWSRKNLVDHLSLWNYNTKTYRSPQSAHWAISIQNIFSDKFKIFRRIIHNGRVKGYLLLVILFLPLSLIQNIFLKESVLNIQAKREER